MTNTTTLKRLGDLCRGDVVLNEFRAPLCQVAFLERWDTQVTVTGVPLGIRADRPEIPFKLSGPASHLVIIATAVQAESWSKAGRDVRPSEVLFHEVDETSDPPVWRGVTAEDLRARLDTSEARLREAFEAGAMWAREPMPRSPMTVAKAFAAYLREERS